MLQMKTRPTRLMNLKLKELSLVDRPACQPATVTIFKRKDDHDEPPAISFKGDPAEIAKALALMDQQIDAQRDRIDAYFGREPEQPSKGVTKMNGLDPFMSAVSKIMARDKITKHAAMSKAAQEEPELLADFRSQDAPADSRAAVIRKGFDRQEQIRAKQREVMKRDGVDAQSALRTLRQEAPEVFEDA